MIGKLLTIALPLLFIPLTITVLMPTTKALNIFLGTMFILIVTIGVNIKIATASVDRMEFFLIIPLFLCITLGTVIGTFIKSFKFRKPIYAIISIPYGAITLNSIGYITDLLEWLGLITIVRLTGG